MNELYRILRYDLKMWDFPRIIEGMLGKKLDSLPKADKLVWRGTDQASELHKRLYETFPRWSAIYENFIHEIVPLIAEESFYYQKVPNFRIQLPENLAVGEFHKDGDYGHPDGEVNFWLPMTHCNQHNTIWLSDDKASRPIMGYPGDILVFDGRNIVHGNRINKSTASRVSFDFRVLPKSAYSKATSTRSINMNLKFAPGHYYSKELIRVK